MWVKSERAGLKVLDEACPRETTEHGDFTVGNRLPCPWERRTVTGVGRFVLLMMMLPACPPACDLTDRLPTKKNLPLKCLRGLIIKFPNCLTISPTQHNLLLPLPMTFTYSIKAYKQISIVLSFTPCAAFYSFCFFFVSRSMMVCDDLHRMTRKRRRQSRLISQHARENCHLPSSTHMPQLSDNISI